MEKKINEKKHSDMDNNISDTYWQSKVSKNQMNEYRERIYNDKVGISQDRVTDNNSVQNDFMHDNSHERQVYIPNKKVIYVSHRRNYANIAKHDIKAKKVLLKNVVRKKINNKSTRIIENPRSELIKNWQNKVEKYEKDNKKDPNQTSNYFSDTYNDTTPTLEEVNEVSENRNNTNTATTHTHTQNTSKRIRSKTENPMPITDNNDSYYGGNSVPENGIMLNFKKRNYNYTKVKYNGMSNKAKIVIREMAQTTESIYSRDAAVTKPYVNGIGRSVVMTVRNNPANLIIRRSARKSIIRKYGTRNVRKALVDINRTLKANGFQQLVGRGYALQNNAIRYKKKIMKQAKKNGQVIPKDVLKALTEAKQLGEMSNLLKKRKDLSKVMHNFSPALTRELSKCEAGQGMMLSTNVARRTTRIISRAYRIIVSTLNSGRKLAQLAILKSVQHSANVLANAKHELSLLERTEDIWKDNKYKAELSDRKENLEKKIANKERKQKRIDKKKKIRKERKDKYSIRRIRKSVSKAVVNKFERIPGIGRVISVVRNGNGKIGRALSGVTRIFKRLFRVISIPFSILSIGAIVILLFALYSIISYEGDIAMSEVSSQLAVVLKQCYENDLYYAFNDSLFEDCEIILSFSEKRNQNLYDRKKVEFAEFSIDENGEEVTETKDDLVSNTAEIISIISAVYGEDYENADINDLSALARDIWNGTHEINYKINTRTGEDGNEYKVARIDYVTEYFDYLFYIDLHKNVRSCAITEAASGNFKTEGVNLSNKTEKLLDKIVRNRASMKKYKDILRAIIQYECGGLGDITLISDKYYDTNALSTDALDDDNVLSGKIDYSLDKEVVSDVPKPGNNSDAMRWLMEVMCQHLEEVKCKDDEDIVGIMKAITVLHLGDNSLDEIKDCATKEDIEKVSKKYIKENSLNSKSTTYAQDIIDKYIKSTSNDITNKKAVDVLNEIAENNIIEPDIWDMFNIGAKLIGYTEYSMTKRQVNGADKPEYLDCSSFTAWCFMKSEVNKKIGYSAYTGTFLEHSSFKSITSNELKPGDIGLKNDAKSGWGANHVGIYLGKNKSGTPLWLHCTNSNRSSLTGNTSGPLISPYSNFTVFKTVAK